MSRTATVWAWAIVGACAGRSTPPSSETDRTPPERSPPAAIDASVSASAPVVDASVPATASKPPPATRMLDDKHYLASHFGECPTSMPVLDDVVKKPPAKPPKPTSKGCVNGPTDTYVAALEAAARRERDKALAGMRATWLERPGTFVANPRRGDPDGNRPEGAEFEAGGQRYLQVGRGTAGDPVRLAKIGTVLHFVIDLPRDYLVHVKSCGPSSCSYGPGAKMRDTSVPLAVKLEPGESVGEPLTLHYDQFFLDAEPTQYVECGPPRPSSRVGR